MRKAIVILLMIKFIAELLMRIMGYVIATTTIVFEEYEKFKKEKESILEKFNMKEGDDKKKEKNKEETIELDKKEEKKKKETKNNYDEDEWL